MKEVGKDEMGPKERNGLRKPKVQNGLTQQESWAVKTKRRNKVRN